jgi:catechol 2,3-dioxygenase-like lactoylglutathione lyase family enzyme
MLNDSTVVAIAAVKDLDEAKKFYGETLGLTQTNENPGGVEYSSGSGRIFVYPSEYAGTNQATTANWKVDDIEAVVNELKSKGVTFEHYDMPGTTRTDDVHDWGGEKGAWFKDPSGNILALSQSTQG